MSPEHITEEDIHRHLYTAQMPDPDLLIRTSGEMRISNFLLWQVAYTEIFVTDRYWPDFRGIHLLEAIADFQRRERRYGGIGEDGGEVEEDPDQHQDCGELRGLNLRPQLSLPQRIRFSIPPPAVYSQP